MVRSWLDDKSALSRYEFGKYTQEKDVQAEICYSSRVDTGYNIMVYHLATWCLPALIPLASLASDNFIFIIPFAASDSIFVLA